MLDRINDTIVAIASAPGHAPLGIVRLSGPNAVAMADSLAVLEVGNELADQRGSSRVTGKLSIESDVILPAVFYVFRAPHSYTRQDSVEIHTVGAPVILEMVRQRLVANGAFPAEPGEFTARAFLNGGMDLAAAEAVSGIIQASTDTQLRASHKMADGELGRRLSDLQSRLAELVALVEADIDFAEEPIEFITPLAAMEKLQSLADALQALMTQSIASERFASVPHILLIGPPNVGKSTLMNRLSGTSRAICAAVAGTTRDILSAPIRLGRGEAIVLDSAGIDQDKDEVVARAREMTLSTVDRVDLICCVVDISDVDCTATPRLAPNADNNSLMIVANKIDLLDTDQIDIRLNELERMGMGQVVAVSGKTGKGILEFRRTLELDLGELPSTTMGDAILISARQRQAIREAHDGVTRAIALCRDAAETIDCADVLAFELREALECLGSVTGAITTDDLLHSVFANFCIGK